ncbi:LysE/ArgO family amino acid transporter [Burkholderia sp. 22PA0106]|uniref:LysE/ArgO family amino acid transporter n=1 Tax=Burkholderia sp. 22PA0106 TaxID=3237371 RepID=UPI0039C3A261
MNWIAFSHGVALCASLIVTIGAQNAYVLRQGIQRAHVGKIVVLCTLSDMLLIAAGVGGASALVVRYPTFIHGVLYAGLAYLAWFGLSALRRALKPGHATLDTGAAGGVAPPPQRAWTVIVATLALTWLNPHVYLDTFLLIGTAGAREAEGTRSAFAVGAMVVSLVWFVGLGYGARLLAPWFKKAIAWRLLDGAIGGMVLCLAAVQLR